MELEPVRPIEERGILLECQDLERQELNLRCQLLNVRGGGAVVPYMRAFVQLQGFERIPQIRSGEPVVMQFSEQRDLDSDLAVSGLRATCAQALGVRSDSRLITEVLRIIPAESAVNYRGRITRNLLSHMYMCGLLGLYGRDGLSSTHSPQPVNTQQALVPVPFGDPEAQAHFIEPGRQTSYPWYYPLLPAARFMAWNSVPLFELVSLWVAQYYGNTASNNMTLPVARGLFGIVGDPASSSALTQPATSNNTLAMLQNVAYIKGRDIVNATDFTTSNGTSHASVPARDPGLQDIFDSTITAKASWPLLLSGLVGVGVNTGLYYWERKIEHKNSEKMLSPCEWAQVLSLRAGLGVFTQAVRYVPIVALSGTLDLSQLPTLVTMMERGMDFMHGQGCTGVPGTLLAACFATLIANAGSLGMQSFDKWLYVAYPLIVATLIGGTLLDKAADLVVDKRLNAIYRRHYLQNQEMQYLLPGRQVTEVGENSEDEDEEESVVSTSLPSGQTSERSLDQQAARAPDQVAQTSSCVSCCTGIFHALTCGFFRRCQERRVVNRIPSRYAGGVVPEMGADMQAPLLGHGSPEGGGLSAAPLETAVPLVPGGAGWESAYGGDDLNV